MNEEELREYHEYLLAQGFRPEEAKEYMVESGVAPKDPSLFMRALGGVAAGLDYVGGLARTGVADIADTASGGGKVTAADWKDAVNPFDEKLAPGSAEYMDRFGVPEGAKVKVPLIGDVSVRDVGGFVGDVALDPLTYLSLGASTLAKEGAEAGVKGAAKKAASIAGTTAQKGGKALYKSGFKKVDEKLLEKGTKPLSDVLWERGRIAGTAEGIQEKAEALGKYLENQRKGLYEQADSLGAKVDMESASQKALKEAQRLQGVRGAEETGKSLEKHVRGFFEPTGQRESLGYVDIPGYKIEGKTTQIRPEYGPHGEVLNKADLTKRTGSVDVPGGRQTVTIEYTDPITKKKTTRIVDANDPALRAVNMSSLDMKVSKNPVAPGGSYSTEIYDPKTVKAPDVHVSDSSYEIMRDPKRRFNWETMKDESVKLPPLSIKEASEIKTRFYDTLPESAFNRVGRLKGDAKKINMLMGGGTADEIVQSANRVKPGLGDEIGHINKDWGSIIESQKPLQREVSKANTQNVISSVDGALSGASMANPAAGVPMAAGKKLGDLSKTTWFRTKSGKALNALGETQILDPLLRRIYIDGLEPIPSPWDEVQKKR